MIKRDFPDLDVVRGYIHDGQVVSHGQWPIVSFADARENFQFNVAMVPVMIGDGHARLDK